MIQVTKPENRFTFKVETGYHLEISTKLLGAIMLLRTNKIKINKDGNGENVSEDSQQDFESYINLFLINHLDNYQIFQHKKDYF